MGTPTITWDGTYEGTPAGSDDPRAADDRIRETKIATRERLEREHGGTTVEASLRHGVHRLGTARAFYQTGDPTVAVDATGTRAFNNTDDHGRLFVDKTTKTLKVLDDAATPLWQYPIADGGYHVKKIDIGDWNMDTTASKSVAHALTLAKILKIEAFIRNDTDGTHYPLAIPPENLSLSGAYSGFSNDMTVSQTFYGSLSVDATNAILTRMTTALASLVSDYWVGLARFRLYKSITGFFDGTDFDATTYNRGWIFVTYID